MAYLMPVHACPLGVFPCQLRQRRFLSQPGQGGSTRCLTHPDQDRTPITLHDPHELEVGAAIVDTLYLLRFYPRFDDDLTHYFESKAHHLRFKESSHIINKAP